MAHPVLWRGKPFFYPIGNTSAVCLTQDLCPSEKADVLLLGCGDPRHILYTVYINSTGPQASRKLDFTCCDLESAVIARNVILFTLLADEGAMQKLPQIWNIFFHLYLDKASHVLLISQCRKLIDLSSDLDNWHNGPYGHFLRMCTKDTLAELRRLWQLYVKTTTFSPSETKEFKSTYAADVKATKTKTEFVCVSSRAAGPLAMYALKMANDHYNIYWETGICSSVPKRPSEVSHPNPTLVYSLAGDKFAVHYGTDPLSCFHLAEALAPAVGSTRHPEQVTLTDVVYVCKMQFSRWCTSVSKVLRSQGSPSSLLIIRCFVGDALSLCQALGYSRTTKSISTPFSVAPWKSACITFDPDTYGTGTQSPAPTTFNIIDTSNLLDHIGMLNILAVIPPILQRTPSATLYMEGLYYGSPADTFPQQLCGDIATIGLLFGLIPVSFVSQFTNRSNMHELMRIAPEDLAHNQIHERIAWKLLGGPEKDVTDLDQPIGIAPEQLAGVLFNVYLDMFYYQNLARSMSMMKRISSSIIFSDIHYHRRSFAEILGVVKRRVTADLWTQSMNMLHGKISGDRTLQIGRNFYLDLCCQLHLLGIFTTDFLSLPKVQEVHRLSRSIVLHNWKMLPQTLCFVLVVPRNRLQPLLPALNHAGKAVLQCEVKGEKTLQTFSCIKTVFGTVKISGKGDGKTATIEEDTAGQYGTSPLVVWFWVPSAVLMNGSRHTVTLSILSNPATCMSLVKTRKLGPDLALFSADIGDEELVHILRQDPDACPESLEKKNTQIGSHLMKTSSACTFVTLDKECKKPLTFTTRVDIVEPEMKSSLASGASPVVNQVSMHSVAIVLGNKSLQLPFPLPVDAKNVKLRIARKSLYIDVILPLKLAPGGTDLMDMFPVIPQGSDLALWNMHRINLNKCVPFSIDNKKALSWIDFHTILMFSERERRIPRGLTTGSTLLDVKRTLQSIFRYASGIADGESPLCYGLLEEQALLVIIFITDLRLDLTSHAMVADAWVMPSSASSEQTSSNMKQLGIAVEERKAWMHLLVAATERCRTWEHKTNCEYRVQSAIPLTLEPDKSPICSCGAGMGTESFVKKYPMLQPFAPCVTRAVISPLFALSYIEKIGNPEDLALNAHPTPEPAVVVHHTCATCGKEGGTSGSLLVCSRCKVVRYCSRGCQRDDWKGHKKSCIALSS